MQTKRLSGREFEALCVKTHDAYRKYRLATIGRYGVQCTFHEGVPVAQRSLPDFEGLPATEWPRQIIYDAKTCSNSSFDLSPYRKQDNQRSNKRRQLAHMYERAEWGAFCFLLVHWNERTFKRKPPETPETFVLPVSLELPLWAQFEAGERKSFTRADCAEYGARVPWQVIGDRGRTPRPDWLAVINAFERAVY